MNTCTCLPVAPNCMLWVLVVVDVIPTLGTSFMDVEALILNEKPFSCSLIQTEGANGTESGQTPGIKVEIKVHVGCRNYERKLKDTSFTD